MTNTEKTINRIIGKSKRIMAYEIVNRLKKLSRFDLLNVLGESVTQHERRKKKHNVFRPSEDKKNNDGKNHKTEVELHAQESSIRKMEACRELS